ncbi:MAG: HEAT repeat domain-containing protein [Planctomycetes bacterium]|nr:HEAT repeat domain-containing protein [Planctomycetota bacterium]
MIEFQCACGNPLKVRDDLAGKKGKCPKCGQFALVPQAGPAPEPACATPDKKGALPVFDLAPEPQKPAEHAPARPAPAKLDFADAPPAARQAPAQGVCVSCKAPKTPEDPFCSACGWDSKLLVRKCIYCKQTVSLSGPGGAKGISTGVNPVTTLAGVLGVALGVVFVVLFGWWIAMSCVLFLAGIAGFVVALVVDHRCSDCGKKPPPGVLTPPELAMVRAVRTKGFAVGGGALAASLLFGGLVVIRVLSAVQEPRDGDGSTQTASAGNGEEKPEPVVPPIPGVTELPDLPGGGGLIEPGGGGGRTPPKEVEGPFPTDLEGLRKKRKEDKDSKDRRKCVEALAAMGPEAIPALVEALEDTDAPARQLALKGLTEEGEAAREALPAIEKRLEDNVSHVRAAAVVALSAIDAAGSVRIFQKTLVTDPDSNVQQKCHDALKKAGLAAAPCWIDLLADGKRRKQAYEALKELGRPALGEIEKGLAHTDATARYSSGDLLLDIGGPEAATPAVPAYIAALSEPEWSARRWGATCLVRVGGPEAKKAVMPVLMEELAPANDFDNRQWAAENLAVIAGPEDEAAIPVLVAALLENAWQLKSGAIRALAKIGPAAAAALARELKNPTNRFTALEGLGGMGEAAVPAITSVLTDRDVEVRLAALAALQKLGPKAAAAIPALEKAIRDSDSRVRSEAFSALAAIGEPAVGELVKALADKSDSVRGEAVMTLQRIGSGAKEALPALVKCLKDENDNVCSLAANAIAEIGGEEAVGLVRPLLRDRDTAVRRRAVGLLGRLGAAAVPSLVDATKDREQDIKMAAIERLGQLGPDAKSAVSALTALVRDPDPQIKALAANALGEIGPDAKSALPALRELAKDPSLKYSADEAIRKIQGN